MTTATKYIKENIQKGYAKKEDDNYNYKKIYTKKIIDYRHTDGAVIKIEKPTNLPKARSLGYKAKQGYVTTFVKVRKGSGLVRRPNAGRRPKRMGVNRITRRISIQRMAEQKAESAFSNLICLNSYYVGEDGQKKYYEVILVDPNHPSIINSLDINWIVSDKHKGRSFRGLTSASKKNRGIVKKGKGTEKNTPSNRAKNRKAK